MNIFGQFSWRHMFLLSLKLYLRAELLSHISEYMFNLIRNDYFKISLAIYGSSSCCIHYGNNNKIPQTGNWFLKQQNFTASQF